MSAASESGVVISATRESFAAPTSTLQNSPTPPAPPLSLSPHNFAFAYSSVTDGANAYKPPVSASSPPPPYQAAGVLPNNLNASPGGEAMKRKRGRPRKYGPDASLPAGGANVQQPPSPHPPPPPPSMKKARGRPPGSGKKQPVEALGSAGIGFTPHVISVKAGEDVSAKIMSFSQHGPRAICILSANGAVSNVTLRQAATSGGTATYEGRFDILSLSGSFLLSEVCGQRSRTGGISVSLAGPGGRVLGGCVAGLLTAASPVQVIVGSFMADGCKESKAERHMEPLNVNPGVASGASSPPSRGTLSESSGGPASPLNQGTGACNNVNPQGIMAWSA